MADYIFYGFFVASKEGKTGLTVTVDVYGPGGTEASAQSATEVGGGLYKYTHTDATDGDYIAVFKTADTSVDAKHVPALATKQLSAYMDAKVSSRMEAASYVAPDNATIGAIDAAVTALAGDVGSLPAGIWAHTPRTLTTPVGTVSPTVTGMDVTVQRGDTWSASLTGLGDLTGREKLWVTAKKSTTETDAQAMWQIEETGGLLVLNRAPAVAPAATSTDGSLTVDDEAAGDITITLKPVASKVLPADTWFIDVQVLYTSGVVQTLAAGTWTSAGDVTRSVA